MKKIKYILLFVLQVIATAGYCQENLEIRHLFDKYGKQEGSVLVQLSSDILSQGSNITFYKSLIMDGNTTKEKDVLQTISADISNSTIISEIKKNGTIESGSYYITKTNKKGEKEYILYKNKADKISIVYLTGNFSPYKLDAELKKLKDLFIYVNNKRFKIQ